MKDAITAACDPQSWAYKLVVGCFALIAIACTGAIVYQAITGRGNVSPELKETLKDSMLVLAGLLARSSGSTAASHVTVDNEPNDPVPTVEGKS